MRKTPISHHGDAELRGGGADRRIEDCVASRARPVIPIEILKLNSMAMAIGTVGDNTPLLSSQLTQRWLL